MYTYNPYTVKLCIVLQVRMGLAHRVNFGKRRLLQNITVKPKFAIFLQLVEYSKGIVAIQI